MDTLENGTASSGEPEAEEPNSNSSMDEKLAQDIKKVKCDGYCHDCSRSIGCKEKEAYRDTDW